MKASSRHLEKIPDRREMLHRVARWKFLGKRIVFTNGCFDILHSGHLELLSGAAALGDILVVGVNSDASVARLKGPGRPVNDEGFRARMLASLSVVDAVCMFGEDTPAELISQIVPDVLVKGGDYAPDDIVGAGTVRAMGGEVVVIPLVQGQSSSNTIERIRRTGK
jgi:rfaE bifunctional protein nucleotidyltransferase chain/domain